MTHFLCTDVWENTVHPNNWEAKFRRPIDEEFIKKHDKLMEDDLIASPTLLHNMKDNVVPLFESHETTKNIMEVLETMYGLMSDIHIRLLLDKYICARNNRDEYVNDFVNQVKLIAKELANVGHFVSNKMPVTNIFNGLPWLREHVVTSSTHGRKEVSMVSLPVLLVLEEERMKRVRREGISSNLMMAQSIAPTTRAPTFIGKPNKFKRKWKGKPKSKNKVKEKRKKKNRRRNL